MDKKENAKDFETLSKFWNDNFSYSDEDLKKVAEETGADEWKEMAPSAKQFDAISGFGNSKCLLDYGCGYGWAGFIASKAGAEKVKGVDISENAIKLAEAYKKAFKTENIDFEYINADWLKIQKDDSFDSAFSSNVLDVIPEDMAEEIVREISRVTVNKGKVILSFNYYMPLENANKSGFEVKGNGVFINGVLRLLSKTDDAWKEMLEKYFDVEKIEYFSWPGETKETRRLMFLKNRK